jgi:hypothetical protein
MIIYRIYIVMVLLAVTFQTVLADPIFNSPVDYPVGTDPVSICGADFDGDLDSDLAIANQGSSSISVLVNNGDGTFQAAVDYTVNGTPVDIVAADFVGSSDIDLAIVSETPDVVSILIGVGDGTFQSELYPVGNTHSSPTAICTGDFDGDGDNDLAVSCYDEGVCYYIYDLAGDNVFHPFDVNYDYGIYYDLLDVVSADFDGDNMDDLAVISYAQRVYVFRSGGSFDWFSGAGDDYHILHGSRDEQICYADVNGDSKIDIIGAVSGSDGGYDIYLGNGDCSFTKSITQCFIPASKLCVTDLDHDSESDIALTGNTLDSVFVALNDGSGSFSSLTAFYAGGDNRFIYGIELNGDNYNDLVVAHGNLNTVSVLINGLYTDVVDNESESLPRAFWLSNNYPNPFNPTTTIKFDLPRRSVVSIDIFNLLGQKVFSLLDQDCSAGSYRVDWDGSTDLGQTASTGVYFYRFRTENFIETKKMILLK